MRNIVPSPGTGTIFFLADGLVELPVDHPSIDSLLWRCQHFTYMHPAIDGHRSTNLQLCSLPWTANTSPFTTVVLNHAENSCKRMVHTGWVNPVSCAVGKVTRLNNISYNRRVFALYSLNASPVRDYRAHLKSDWHHLFHKVE